VSHPLGVLWDSAPAITTEQVRDTALRAAVAAIANGQYVSAVAELEASRDAARMLSRMLQDVDAVAEEHQLANVDQTEAWLAQACEAATAPPAPVITLTPAPAAVAA